MMQKCRKSHTNFHQRNTLEQNPWVSISVEKFHFIWNAAKHLHHHTDVKKHPGFCRARTAPFDIQAVREMMEYCECEVFKMI